MLDYTKEQLVQLGAEITTREIYQQPEVWQETFNNYKNKEAEIKDFLNKIEQKHNYIKVIFAGAGTSAYVGESILPHFRTIYDESKWNFNSIPTTDIVSNPLAYLHAEIPTVLVSFARSGNSPESVATVHLAKQLVKELYQITITCAEDGKLASQAHGDERNLLLLQPKASNDAGFAMTSSFTSMLLTALLVFDKDNIETKEKKLNIFVKLAKHALSLDKDIQKLVELDYNRVIYLGSGSFFGLAHEAQLKILELTAGKIATMYESTVGFRHGPKSLIDENTVVLIFGSVNPYTRKYDLDLVREVARDKIARKVVLISNEKFGIENTKEIVFDTEDVLNDVYLVFPYIVYAQLFALLSSIKIKNKPDTPSPTGTVNRVVKGVIIHEFVK